MMRLFFRNVVNRCYEWYDWYTGRADEQIVDLIELGKSPWRL